MMHCRGSIVGLRHFSGRVEVLVIGENAASSPNGNYCFQFIIDRAELTRVGGPIEYEEAQLRFRNSPEAIDDIASQDDVFVHGC